MDKIFDDLWETTPFRVPNGPTTHAYLWTPPGRGNALFYNVGDDRDLDSMASLGGVDRQYLSHQDEISPLLRTISERFESSLHSSAAEEHLVAATRPPDVVFDRRHVDDLGVEIVPTPGHTPGSACYLVDGVGGRYLFTGDTIIRGADGRWFAGYIPSFSDREQLLSTLEVLAGLDADVVASSAFAGDRGVHVLDRPWRDCVSEAIDALTASAST